MKKVHKMDSILPTSRLYKVCELTGKSQARGYVIDEHHIFPVGSHPDLKYDKRNISYIYHRHHINVVHGKERKRETFKLFDNRADDPEWIAWALTVGSKLFIEWYFKRKEQDES